MGNPALLFVDSDALIQLLMVGGVRVLRELKTSYGLQAVVAPEVEIEVVSSRRFGNRFKADFAKARSISIIKVFDSATFAALLQSSSVLRDAAAGVSYAELQTLGAAYYRRVDRGEAYTFASAVKLAQPALSNDVSAIRILESAGMILPAPVLRAFDIITFAHQIGLFDANECDSFRQSLVAEGEVLPGALRSTSFLSGLRSYVPRLVDGKKPTHGCAVAAGTPSWAMPLILNQER